MTALTTIDFHGAKLIAVRGETPDTTLVAMKPVVEGMGLDWGGQHKKLVAHPVLAKGISITEIPSPGGPQSAVMLPLNRLNFWLATVQPDRVKDPDVRARIIEYQTECADVLFAHFFGKTSAPPPANLNDPHTLRAALLGYTERVIVLESENAMLGAQVEHLAPKAAALDLIANKSGAESVSTTAKGLRIRPGDLFAWLDNNGWIFRVRDGAPWRGYQTKIDAGYLTVRETPDRTRDDRTFMQVMVTPKGRARIAELLTQGDLLQSGAKRKAA